MEVLPVFTFKNSERSGQQVVIINSRSTNCSSRFEARSKKGERIGAAKYIPIKVYMNHNTPCPCTEKGMEQRVARSDLTPFSP